MLEMSFVRENVDFVRENLNRRKSIEFLNLFEELLTTDELWRKLKGKVDAARARRNKISMEISEAKKKGNDPSELLKEAAQIPKVLEEAEQELARLEAEQKNILLRLPNIMHESVPNGEDDSQNVVVNTFGKKPSFTFEPKSHVDLLEQNGWVDTERAAKIAGSRWYFLKGDLAVLEMALSMYALDFMRKRGFTPIVPPFMMSKEAYEGVTSLDDFENVMYKIEDEDLYAIATSEHPLTAMWMNEVIEKLPIKLAGLSTCFRKEAGTHGKDEKGIFRVHQFNKVEQIVICKPSESWHVHEELLKNATDFFESLGLHFQVVNVCTGDLGIVAAKKYDVEAWYPSQNKFREVVSGSNCTSYQAARLNIKYLEGGERKFVHTLNCTCVATSRALVAIIENFQKADGTVEVPKVLQPYCNLKVIGSG